MRKPQVSEEYPGILPIAMQAMKIIVGAPISLEIGSITCFRETSNRAVELPESGCFDRQSLTLDLLL
jgi:hypothetical protein